MSPCHTRYIPSYPPFFLLHSPLHHIFQGATKECIAHGPWGGSQGEEWVYMPERLITKISVRYGEVIDSIKFETFNSIGETQASLFGGPGGNRTHNICVCYPQEYLISISGTFGSYQGFMNVVKSISFTTNMNRYGPYGTDSGTAFSYDGKGGVIIGFHGHLDKFLNSIGIYVLPESLAFNQIFTYEGKITHELGSSMSRMVMPRSAGPWGAGGGKSWDDGVFLAVKHVRIYLGELNVYAVQFEYLRRDGKFVLSPIHGGRGATKVEEVTLDGVDEHLKGISGFYSSSNITSISFHTNKQKYGPYGSNSGTGFSSYMSEASPGKVVGFHGCGSDGYLTRIGIHTEYF